MVKNVGRWAAGAVAVLIAGPVVVLGPSAAQAAPVGGVPGSVLYFSDDNAGKLQRIAADGTLSSQGGGFFTSWGVAVASDGTRYVADPYNGRVVKITAGGVQSDLSVTGLQLPYGLAVDDADNLYIADGNAVAVFKVTPAGVDSQVPFTGLVYPDAIAVAGDGTIYVADQNNSRVVKRTPAGVQSDAATGVGQPFGLALGHSGELYVGDQTGKTWMITAAGVKTTVDSTFAPMGMSVADNGELYAANPNGAIYRLLPSKSSVVSGASARGLVVQSPPAPPTGVGGVAAGSGTVTVSWTAAESSTVRPVTGYTVTSSPGNLTCTATTATHCDVTGLSTGVQYTFAVTATNAIGTSPDSAPSSGITLSAATAPAAPTGLALQPGDTTADVSFTPGSDGGSPITRYEISTDNGATWATIATSSGPAGTRTATLTGLQNGTTYTVKVRAVNAVGAGAAGGAQTVTPVAAAPAAPAAPASVTAVAGTSSITVNWTAPPAGGAAVTGYTATAVPGPASCTTTTATSCVLGAEAGQTYTVTVVAHSAGGDSPAATSGAVIATAPVAPPVAPDAPLTLTTDQGKIDRATPGQHIVVIGTGFAPYSTARIALYSTPVDLGSVVTDASGDFRKSVIVPAGLATGSHQVVAQGVAPDGTARAMKFAVSVAVAGRLPVTGPATASPVALGLLALVLGFLLTRAGRLGERLRPSRFLPAGSVHNW